MTKHGAEHNLCRVCGVDYGHLEYFELHRKDFKIVSLHSLETCSEMHDQGIHVPEECQRLTGLCRTPQSLGLEQGVGGAWYTSQFLAKIQHMRAGLK